MHLLCLVAAAKMKIPEKLLTEADYHPVCLLTILSFDGMNDLDQTCFLAADFLSHSFQNHS
jgi:hypothetical protein